MKLLNYTKLMSLNPDVLDSVVNQAGQTIEFYEHPIHGDSAPVIAVNKDLEMAANTDFFDTDDFYQDSDYNPIFEDGKCFCAYEMGY